MGGMDDFLGVCVFFLGVIVVWLILVVIAECTRSSMRSRFFGGPPPPPLPKQKTKNHVQ